MSDSSCNQTQFVSPAGWQLVLPDGWEPLEAVEAESEVGETLLVPVPPMVFAFSKDWSLKMSWKVDITVASSLMEVFQDLTILSGPARMPDTLNLLERLGVVRGEVVESNVLTLPGGEQALSVEETLDGDTSRLAFHFLLPYYKRPFETPALQEFFFSAPEEYYYQHIDALKAALNALIYP
ncbi:MAG: hypothetical protein KC777_03285 [Cyanobacteria bacterium HKST-UBA02]|nr:hypothetical protein [Cyanobacteria bacterium HKST-UBA02]